MEVIDQVPTENRVKAALMDLPLALAGVPEKLKAIQNANRGFVTWCATAPANTPWIKHKDTFLETLYLGLAFCWTDTRYEWTVMGIGAFYLLRSLSEFVQVEPQERFPLVYVGQVRSITVYVPSVKSVHIGIPIATERCFRFPPYRFYVGVENRAVQGSVVDATEFRDEMYVEW